MDTDFFFICVNLRHLRAIYTIGSYYYVHGSISSNKFLILTATIKDAPYLAPLFLIGLGVAFAAIFRRVLPMVAGPIPPIQKPLKAAHVPVILHLILVLILGLYMPKFLSQWFHTAVGLLR
ncbi:MAG: hypothetical protein ABH870_04045 [bacterium]